MHLGILSKEIKKNIRNEPCMVPPMNVLYPGWEDSSEPPDPAPPVSQTDGSGSPGSGSPPVRSSGKKM